jgi:hypothetical protein
MTSRPPGFPLVVGMAMGFLPCPLIYAGLAGAAASGSPGAGAAILAGVALGTLPALTLAAVFGTAAFRPGTRLFLARAAGVLLVVTGLLTAGRGFGFRPGHGLRHLRRRPGLSLNLLGPSGRFYRCLMMVRRRGRCRGSCRRS